LRQNSGILDAPRHARHLLDQTPEIARSDRAFLMAKQAECAAGMVQRFRIRRRWYRRVAAR
jgi:hypothetical protein